MLQGRVDARSYRLRGSVPFKLFTVTGQASVALVQLIMHSYFLLCKNEWRLKLSDFLEIWTVVILYPLIWEKAFIFAVVPKVAKFRSKCKILASEL